MPSLHIRAWPQAEGRGDQYSSRPVPISSSSSPERGGIPAGGGVEWGAREAFREEVVFEPGPET